MYLCTVHDVLVSLPPSYTKSHCSVVMIRISRSSIASRHSLVYIASCLQVAISKQCRHSKSLVFLRLSRSLSQEKGHGCTPETKHLVMTCIPATASSHDGDPASPHTYLLNIESPQNKQRECPGIPQRILPTHPRRSCRGWDRRRDREPDAERNPRDKVTIGGN